MNAGLPLKSSLVEKLVGNGLIIRGYKTVVQPYLSTVLLLSFCSTSSLGHLFLLVIDFGFTLERWSCQDFASSQFRHLGTRDCTSFYQAGSVLRVCGFQTCPIY